MFARLKDTNGNNVTLVAYKVQSMLERKSGDDKTTEITMDGGNVVVVAGSERAVRSAMTKAMSAPASDTDAGDEASAGSTAE